MSRCYHHLDQHCMMTVYKIMNSFWLIEGFCIQQLCLGGAVVHKRRPLSYICSLYEIFPAMAPAENTTEYMNLASTYAVEPGLGRSPGTQALWQLVALIVTIGMGVASGCITGKWTCMPERFPHHRLQRKPPVSDPDMPWCMSGSQTRDGWENIPSFPGACTTHNFTFLARGP